MPLTIHTITLEAILKGANLLIEQKAIGKPNGTPKSRVTAKMISDITNPLARKAVISKKVIKKPFTQILLTRSKDPVSLF